MSIHIHQIPLFKAVISVRSPENDPRTLPSRCSLLIWVCRPGSARNFAFRRDYPTCFGRQGVFPTERLSDSVHARMRRLQAIDRQEARLDRPHRPAARRDPELLPVSRAAEFLSRSTRRARFESAATPQAGSMQELLARFEPCGNRSAIRVCGNECGSRRFRDRPFNGFIEDFRGRTPPCNNTREPVSQYLGDLSSRS